MYIVDIEHNTTVITATQPTSSANIVNHNTSSEYYISQYINYNNSFITSIKEEVQDCTIQSSNIVHDENYFTVRLAQLFPSAWRWKFFKISVSCWIQCVKFQHCYLAL